MSINQDPAFSRVIQARDQVRDRRLSCTAGSNQCRQLAGLDREGDILQCPADACRSPRSLRRPTVVFADRFAGIASGSLTGPFPAAFEMRFTAAAPVQPGNFLQSSRILISLVCKQTLRNSIRPSISDSSIAPGCSVISTGISSTSKPVQN